MNIFQRLNANIRTIKLTLRKIDQMHQALGRIEAYQRRSETSRSVRDYEFKVSSQWGEDGIIQFLVREVPIARSIFVEFGVQDYTEANTRFLLRNNYWSGLIIDGSPANIDAIRRDDLYWLYNLKAQCSFITRENINQILETNGVSGEIGLLSVDIDGNDYWVWEAITSVSPAIVVCEYNSLFGPTRQVTVPYRADFVRGRAHYSHLYYGASVAAFEALGRRKGYCLVGSNRAGNNLFFVREDLRGSLAAVSPEEAYVQAAFREARNPEGQQVPLDFAERLALIADLELFDLVAGTPVLVRELQ